MEPAPLTELRLRPGDRVRFQHAPGGRWHEGTVHRRERDGSVALHETGNGAARAIAADRLHVLTGDGRKARWEPVVARAARPEQLSLL